MNRHQQPSRCIVIAGPNGAGKTTFARRYLPDQARVVHFINADLIAGGLSPLKPELAAIAAARLVLQEFERLAAQRLDFAFETTLSGLTYSRRLRALKSIGYRIEIVYLRLKSARLATRRIAARVRQGGHDVAKKDVVRRFARSWENFQNVYRPLADSWAVYENSGTVPVLLENKAVKAKARSKKHENFAVGVGRALRSAAKDAQKIARMYGTPIYVWKNGRVVAKKP